MTIEELKEWHKLYKQVINGYHMEKHDWQELVSLNHKIMEASHKIHNDNMQNYKSYCTNCGDVSAQNGKNCKTCGKKMTYTL